MKMKNKGLTSLVQAGLIAGIYTAVTILLVPISFGAFQVRIAESLTLLAIYSPTCIWGLSVGCLLSNIIGAIMGANLVVDIFVGTLATLIAGILSYLFRNIRFKNLPILSAIPPIIINAVFIGAEIALLTLGDNANYITFLTFGMQIAVGQIISCAVLGLPLIYVLEKSKINQKIV